MNPGQLDRRIQFLRATASDDGIAQDETFSNHGSRVWAQKKEISDGERWRAGEVAAHITARFVVRWSRFTAGITPKDCLVCEGRNYDITGIKEIEGRRQWLEITTAVRID
jgi:SPP1 family predicted phage head-tail adaptor